MPASVPSSINYWHLTNNSALEVVWKTWELSTSRWSTEVWSIKRMLKTQRNRNDVDIIKLIKWFITWHFSSCWRTIFLEFIEWIQDTCPLAHSPSSQHHQPNLFTWPVIRHKLLHWRFYRRFSTYSLCSFSQHLWTSREGNRTSFEHLAFLPELNRWRGKKVYSKHYYVIRLILIRVQGFHLKFGHI